MNLRSLKLMLNLMYIVCMLIIVGGIFLNQFWLIGVAAVLLVIQSILKYKFYRCPKCKAMLARGNRIHCNECHWELL